MRTQVKVIGFRVPSTCHEPEVLEMEKDYVALFKGKEGIIESWDFDPTHPIMVYFGESAPIRRCRFAPQELAAPEPCSAA